MPLNERSLKNLEGVHPDLVRVVKSASEKIPFIVTEGLRTIARQKQLVKAGKSWTLNSRHLTGHAVDLCDDDAHYDIPDMDHIRDAMFAAAKECNVPLEWGGDWKVRDTPHFQLPFKSYPASGVTIKQKAVEVAVKVATSRTALTAAAGGSAAAVATPAPHIPAPPPAVTDAVTNAGMWKELGETVHSFGAFAWEQPWLVGAIIAVVVILLAGPRFLPEKWRFA